FIGEECGNKVLCDCTVITSPYIAKDKIIGVIGIIGPTRMPYERVIPIINLTAKLLGSALNPH
ncbi:MAG: heat-inducible transcriptional repressor HrcA, partial [Proteobacteria bacterium]|nr:heat-inducible transcriptional repressor HrcA [Pseudomonadota bacterium]